MSKPLRGIFFTQSTSLQAFYRIQKKMDSLVPGGLEAAFYVTDKRNFERFSKQPENNLFPGGVCEWELFEAGLKKAQTEGPDLEYLKRFESQYGNPTLWNVLIAERRIYHGKHATFRQSYEPRFSHHEMLCILEVIAKKIERLFDEFRPDFVLSYQFITAAEYIGGLIAKKSGIKILNIRLARIQNYVLALEDFGEPTPEWKKLYHFKTSKGLTDFEIASAQEILRHIQKVDARYEGVVSASLKPPKTAAQAKGFLAQARAILGILRAELRWRWGDLRFDSQIQSVWGVYWFSNYLRPLNARRIHRKLGPKYIQVVDLPQLEYAFFPLHVEPEVSLSLYGAPYLNQIEAIRLFARSLPVGMKLLVKEHPWAIGRRKLSYYEKILNIPNVLLASPGIDSRDLIRGSQLVTCISGTVGQEAVFMKKPAVLLGQAPFLVLPKTMIRCVSDPYTLADEIFAVLRDYQYDESAILTYIAQVMQEGCAVDFWTKIFGRAEGFSATKDSQKQNGERESQEAILARYLIKKLIPVQIGAEKIDGRALVQNFVSN